MAERTETGSGLSGLGILAGGVAARESRSRADHARLLARDAGLWPAAAGSAASWMGWLDSLARAEEHLRGLHDVVGALLDDGITQVVLIGMGGSSLFPMVLTGACGRAAGRPELHVLDSVDPAAVVRLERTVDWSRAAVVAASKSGTTVETLAHLDRFLLRLSEACGSDAPSRIVVITDPGGPLEERARSEGFRAVVPGDADVGGRYSALSPFGLLPAVLLGLDVDTFLDHARSADARWRDDPWSSDGPALLAAFLAEGVASGRDALHLIIDARAGLLGAWIEQLVAESSGKDGTGVVPVVVASTDEVVARSRAAVVAIGAFAGLADLAADGVPTLSIPWSGCTHLGAEALRWMQAVPLACAQLAVDPFDQPDVASAKAATAEALERGSEPDGPVTLAELDGAAAGAGYVAVLAYVDPDGDTARAIADAAPDLARRYGVPVTVGVGPRYLHSTGQLHKGGRDDGIFLMVVGDDPDDVPIPGRPYGFSRLKRAQAAGDLAALRAAGRRAEVIALEELLGRA